MSYFQFRVGVRDQGVPSLTSNQQASVTINVQRNNVAPVFQLAPYSVTVNRSVVQGSVIFDANAVDTDIIVSSVFVPLTKNVL